MRYTLSQIKDGTGFKDGQTFEPVEDYNGWTNRETWAVALHINNDQGLQESMHDAIRNRDELGEWLDTHDGMSVETAARYAGDAVREEVEYLFDSIQEEPDMRSRDLIMIMREVGSLWRVNWTELGASFLDDIAEGE